MADQLAAPIPDVVRGNLYLEDPLLQRFLHVWLPRATLDGVRDRFIGMGATAAAVTPLAARADRATPVLQSHDAAGRRVDRVVLHPDYVELKRRSYGEGLLAIKYDPAFLAAHGAHRHLVGFTLGYLFGQSELGLFCPICMTDGVGRVLERAAPDDPVAKETRAHLASTDLDALWEGAMFLTERQGGSDVGANAVQATQDADGWTLHGDKWFCSNVDAKAILVLARMPGHGPETGTRGLGLFLVLRERPADNGATIRIHRLKDKLGVRSMATGEVTFEGTRAHLVGGAGAGFKQMAEMLNLSRLYNAVASVAVMRRATAEALAYGRGRHTFGTTLDRLPLWRATLADLAAESLGAFVLTFETIRALDAADQGDAEAARLLRCCIPMAKATTAKLAVFVCSEAMEAVGGNGYIEDWIFPRLLRDAQVLPIWEGTTNVLALDTLRAILKAEGDTAVVGRVRAALVAAEGAAPERRDRGLSEGVAADCDALEALAARLRAAAPNDRERAARGWMDHAARTLTKALLLEATAHADLARPALAAARRLHARSSATAPVAGAYSAVLDATEAALLEVLLPRDGSA